MKINERKKKNWRKIFIKIVFIKALIIRNSILFWTWTIQVENKEKIKILTKKKQEADQQFIYFMWFQWKIDTNTQDRNYIQRKATISIMLCWWSTGFFSLLLFSFYFLLLFHTRTPWLQTICWKIRIDEK